MANTQESILDSVKEFLGIVPEETAFDFNIQMHINSVFATLNQLGVGPSRVFSIADNTAKWTDFINGNDAINAVKSYVCLRVKLYFDPPPTSFVLDSMKSQVTELEWRLNVVEWTPAESNSNGSGTTEPLFWDLSNGADFPEEAPVGSYGIDLVNGDFWRKV